MAEEAEDGDDLAGAPAHTRIMGSGNTGNGVGDKRVSLQSLPTATLVAKYRRFSGAKSRREVKLGRGVGQVPSDEIESDPQKRLWLEQDLTLYVHKMAEVKAELWQRPDGPAAFLVGIDDTSELMAYATPVESVAEV